MTLKPTKHQLQIVENLINDLYDYSQGRRTPSKAFDQSLSSIIQTHGNGDLEPIGLALLTRLVDLNGSPDKNYGEHQLNDRIGQVEAALKAKSIEPIRYRNAARLTKIEASLAELRTSFEKVTQDHETIQESVNINSQELNQNYGNQTVFEDETRLKNQELENELGALKRLVDGLDRKSANADSVAQGVRQEFNALSSELQSIDGSETKIANLLESVHSLDTKMKTFEADLVSFRDRLQNDVKLSSAVKYWGDQIDDHSTSFNITRNWATVHVAFFVILVFVAFNGMTKNHFPEDVGTPLAIVKLLIVGLMLTLPLILFRVLLRAAMSSLHLRAEAQNRKVLTQVYLGLLEQSSKLGVETNDEQRSMILSSLFNPITVGLIKDESSAIEPSVIAALSKAFSPKGSS